MTPADETSSDKPEVKQLRDAIASLEAQRDVLGDGVTDASITALKNQIAQLLEEEREVDQQRKLATILFTDIVGHTKLVQNLDPEENMAVIDGGLVRLARVVEAHGGHVARYQGDGFKAVFGLPMADEADPHHAVRAGLDLIEEAATYAHELATEWGIQGFNVRVGIDTGLIVAGGATEAEDTIKGLVVNLAARLESAAPPGGVLISQHTYQHVRGFFEVEALQPISAKGFPYLVPVYLVKRARPRQFRQVTRGVEGLETKMVGRDDELQVLTEAFAEAVERRQTTLVTISGEAGVGKSRLLLEFEQKLKDLAPTTLVLRGRASPQARGSSQFLWREVMGGYFKILDSDSLDTVRQKFTEGIGATLPTEGTMKGHLLGSWLGYDFRGSPYLAAVVGAADQLKRRATQYLGEFLTRASINKPVLIMLEDIHWADGGSLDTVLALVRQNIELPLMILCLARPSHGRRYPNWGQDVVAHLQIELAPLNEEYAGSLISELLQRIVPLPQSLLALISSRAEGNPFFAEELVKMLIDEGSIIVGTDRWQFEPDWVDLTEVPPTLTGVLQARIDRLQPLEKEALQQASVIGRIFWDRALNALPHEGERGLPGLEAKAFIFAQATSTFAQAVAYIFKHALLRDVAYETVLLRLRRDYHARIARWLEENAWDRLDEFAGLIADHYTHAGVGEKASAYWQRAGDAAFRTGNYRDARDAFAKALEMNPEEEPLPLAKLHGRLAATLPILQEPGQAEVAYRHALRLLEGEAPPDEYTAWQSTRLTMMLGLIDTFYWQMRPDEMEAQQQSLEALLAEVGTLKQKADYYERLSQIAFLQNQSILPRDRLPLVQKALTFAEESGETLLIARKRFHLGFHYLWYRELDKASELLQPAWSGAKAGNDIWLATQCHAYLSVLYRLRGDMVTLEEQLPHLLDEAEQIGFANYRGVGRSGQAWLHYRKRKWKLAEEEARAALEAWAATGYPIQWLAQAVLLATTLHDRRVGESVAAAQAMISPPQQRLPQEMASWLQEGVTHFQAGDDKAAEAALQRAIEGAQGVGYL